MERQRKSQFKYDGENADEKERHLVNSDLPIFDILNPQKNYRELPGPWIAALIGRQYQPRFWTRLSNLARAPNNYLIRYQEAYNFALYKRSDKRHRRLTDSYKDTPEPRRHRLIQDLHLASIELGIKNDPRFRLAKWHELTVPMSTQTLIDKGGDHRHIGHCVPDGDPFKLLSETAHIYFLGREIDCDTEPLTTTQKRRNIKEKFEHYQQLFDAKLWTSHYGFDNALVIWVTTSENRMNAMMRVCAEVYQRPVKHHLFTWTDWLTQRQFPLPSDTMFTRPYKRVRNPDYYLNGF